MLTTCDYVLTFYDDARERIIIRSAKKMATVEQAVAVAAEELLYGPLKEDQSTAITKYLQGNDVFVTLPTGYGKSVCYACLPKAYDLLHKKSLNWSIILVISPLTALMADQVRSLKEHNINSGNLNSDSDEEEMRKVFCGEYNVLFMSPEMLVKKGREILLKDTYRERLVGVAVDEAHCVAQWYIVLIAILHEL